MRYTVKQKWMRDFERQAVENGIYEPGRVNFYDAFYLYITGRTVFEALTALKHNDPLEDQIERERQKREGRDGL